MSEETDRVKHLRQRLSDMESAKRKIEDEIRCLVMELNTLTEDLKPTRDTLVIKDSRGIRKQVPRPTNEELSMSLYKGIKAYRERTGLLLSDSKRAIEEGLDDLKWRVK